MMTPVSIARRSEIAFILTAECRVSMLAWWKLFPFSRGADINYSSFTMKTSDYEIMWWMEFLDGLQRTEAVCYVIIQTHVRIRVDCLLYRKKWMFLIGDSITCTTAHISPQVFYVKLWVGWLCRCNKYNRNLCRGGVALHQVFLQVAWIAYVYSTHHIPTRQPNCLVVDCPHI